MYVLHALWKSEPPGSLLLWGETSEKSSIVKKPKGRQSKIPKPLPHPFALPGEKLKEIVTEISGSLIGESASFDKLAISLPSANGLPTPSPQLIRDQDEPPIAPEALQPWYVPSAVFEPGVTLDFLLSLPNHPAPAIALGASIRYWAEAAKFAIELLTLQSFFPLVLEDKTEPVSYRAAWSAYFSETDFTRVEKLAKANATDLPGSPAGRIARNASAAEIGAEFSESNHRSFHSPSVIGRHCFPQKRCTPS
jgi:hypothetical protein